MTDTTFDLEITLNDRKKKVEKRSSARAQRRWRLLKNVRVATKRTSLTKCEKDLLKAIDKKKEVQTFGEDANATTDSENASNAAESSDSSARRRLRQSITVHRDSLSIDEVMFLQDLLDAESVSDEALSSATEVLEKDVIYKQKLSVSEDVNVTVTAHSRKRSSILSSSIASFSASVQSSMMASIPEFEPEETLEKDVAYRKELWRTRQRSTSFVEDDNDKEDNNKAESGGEPEAPTKSQESLITTLKESPLMISIRKYIDNSSAETLDTQAMSSSEDEEENKKEISSAKDKKPSQAPVLFSFLGMSPTDEIMTGLHVMTPPLMDTIRQHMPYAIQEDNFWMKYSLAHDVSD
uniref:BSD domain-containing protein n=1 Tax=Pseudictyota dubia TaxID=2749911 RepID=A0A7R9ZEY4_9STRA|mmetsp:Transcript_42830/g.79323  ORF Transcript_42830/g.79323 Transcript_42830/m.79323 type:complete len:352 (+) Transcript_42830:127-1182(+)